MRKTVLLFFVLCSVLRATAKQPEETPRIANIINFVRQIEPRPVNISTEDLYNTVAEQIKLARRYNLPNTFLLQYDALIDPKYEQLFKTELPDNCEIGGWWEITEPHVKAAGIVWRGEYPWDWHANVGFATGYTPEEREKLVDVYMEKFKTIFGKYPESIGSWFIDAHTLGYMSDKYGIVASCNCKDQVGTDGYTLWGGYWNQAYYPSRKNGYIPGQTPEGQIPVPVFRMLGSDPIHQYYSGLGGSMQAVESLEPVYSEGGGSEKWVDWFFDIIANAPSLGFQYTQAGQENSFNWPRMRHGLEMQMPKLDSMRRAGRIRVETLAATGKWFKQKYKTTPSTSVTAFQDIKPGDAKSIWYNSRFYRTSLFWEKDQFLIRDIHLFNENFRSDYLTSAGTTTWCDYRALPFVDGFSWSDKKLRAGIRIIDQKSGTEVAALLPTVENRSTGEMIVKFSTATTGDFAITFTEEQIEVSGSNNDWCLEFSVAKSAQLPFRVVTEKQITASFKEFTYKIDCRAGKIEPSKTGRVFGYRIHPEKTSIKLHTGYR